MALSIKIFPPNKQCSRPTRPRKLVPTGGADEGEKYNSVLITVTCKHYSQQKNSKALNFPPVEAFYVLCYDTNLFPLGT